MLETVRTKGKRTDHMSGVAFHVLKTDDAVFKKFVMANMGLIKNIALQVLRRYPNISYYFIQPDGAVQFEELINEGVIGFYIAREKYDETKGTKFTTYASFWIRAQIETYVQNFAKHHTGTNENVTEEIQEIINSTDVTPQEYLEEEVTNAKLKEALGTLDEIDRKIIVMKYLQRKKLSEIAQEVSLSISTVEDRARKAIAKLKKYLQNYL